MTPTIPGRERLLGECCDSVRAQTFRPVAHLVRRDTELTGAVGPILNKLASMTDCEWLSVIADDDVMFPNHLEVHSRHMDEGYGVIYSWCKVEGRGQWNPNQDFDPVQLRSGNFIPAVASIRRELWQEVGGWGGEKRMEDWEFWKRCLAVGAEFKCDREVTWQYRFHGANKSLMKP